MKKINFIVSSKDRFHSLELASELNKKNCLKKLITTYPKNFIEKNYYIPKEKIISLTYLLIVRKTINILPLKYRRIFIGFLNEIYDLIVSFIIPKNFNVFIGWSSVSLKTLKKIKNKNKLTFIEKGSIHIKDQNEIMQKEYKKYNINYPKILSSSIKREEEEYKLVDKITITSNFVKKTFNKRNIKNKFFLNPVGVNAKNFNFNKKKIQLNNFNILYVGGITIGKGLPYLINAFNDLNLKNSKLHLVGKSEKYIKNLVNRINNPNIILHGHKNIKELKKFYQFSNIFCHPSPQDGGPLTLIQSMLNETPAIITLNTMSKDVIKNGVDGFIIKPFSTNEIKKKLLFAFKNKKKIALMGKKARQKVLGKFTFEDYAKRYIDYSKKIISKN
ncbi:glycosyltransferase family 4 protein [Candidatus Pelagibacter communis]|uniref:glycosyltransferase family 4 protein n=1 Tax=Pelagibacter ubique TaxID=198252 RepID=UPI00094C361B|nr:glycosyltransferase family 4 protein [Candidatus Pelagibacter ubique]